MLPQRDFIYIRNRLRLNTVTKKGNIVALERKGEDRISNEDTAYKVEMAKEWEKLGKGKLNFFLVHNGNSEEVLTQLRTL